MNRSLNLILISLLIAVGSGCAPKPKTTTRVQIPAPELKRLSSHQYGIDVNSLKVVQANFEQNQFLTDILQEYSVNSETIDLLARKSEHIFDVRRMKAGNSFTILVNDNQAVDYFIYDKNKADYVVFDLRDSVDIYEGRRETEKEIIEVAGVISASLYETIEKNQMDIQLAEWLEKAFAWSVDFRHLEKGDFFKVIYEEEYVDGESMGISQILAAQFQHDKKDYFAYNFKQDVGTGFYDDSGNNLRTSFLRLPPSPSKELRKQLANSKDETPVFITGDGKIFRIRYHGALGYSVRIQHAPPYASIYQYVSQLAPNIKPGKRVKKGKLLGYLKGKDKEDNPLISMTFLKKGKLIDLIEVNNTAIDQIQAENKTEFSQLKKKMKARLKKIPFPEEEKMVVFNK